MSGRSSSVLVFQMMSCQLEGARGSSTTYAKRSCSMFVSTIFTLPQSTTSEYPQTILLYQLERVQGKGFQSNRRPHRHTAIDSSLPLLSARPNRDVIHYCMWIWHKAFLSFDFMFIFRQIFDVFHSVACLLIKIIVRSARPSTQTLFHTRFPSIS